MPFLTLTKSEVKSVTTTVNMIVCFVGAVGTFIISNDRPLPSSAGPTHSKPDGHYLLDSLGVSQSKAPDYSMSGVWASMRGQAQWYRGSRVV